MDNVTVLPNRQTRRRAATKAEKRQKCECYRRDTDDPTGQTPASAKLEQLETIFLIYQFLTWNHSSSAAQVRFLRTRLCDKIGWTDEEFDACLADATRMYVAFGKASDAALKEMPERRLIVPNSLR